MSSPLKYPLLPPREDARFEPLMKQAEENWRENNPKLVKSLEKSGKLQAMLESAVDQAILVLQQSEVKGLAPDQARELAYQSLYLPNEGPA